MDTSVNTLAGTTPSGVPAVLRKLYFVRFAFAAVWAALLFATADTIEESDIAFDRPVTFTFERSAPATVHAFPAPAATLKHTQT